MIITKTTTYSFDMIKEMDLAKIFEEVHDIQEWKRTTTDTFINYTQVLSYDNYIKDSEDITYDCEEN